MRHFFAFRTMITAGVVQVLFVLGLIVVVIAGIGAIASAPGLHDSTHGATSTGASTATTGTLPPAGWYPDTERPGRKRWWDGTRWGKRDDEEQSEPQ